MRLDSLERAFDALAENHDRMRWESDGSPFDTAVDEELWSVAGGDPAADRRALFLGAGSGSEARAFIEHGWTCDLVDISPRMLEHAHRRLAGTQAVLHQADARSFLLAARGTYLFISMVGELIGYTPVPVELLRAARRRLSTNGLLVLTWVDARTLVRAGHPVEDGGAAGVVMLRERMDLCIRAWSRDRMLAYLEAAGLVRIQEVGDATGTPRRCWIAGRKEGTDA